MDLDAAKKLVKEYMPGHAAFALKADIGERYYTNKKMIFYSGKKQTEKKVSRKKKRIH